ncbi:hypothetical protein [Gimesia panareensis]|nr:hypothetical protein [Gimesia panareensis]
MSGRLRAELQVYYIDIGEDVSRVEKQFAISEYHELDSRNYG